MALDKKSKSAIAVYAIALFVYIIAFIIIPFNKTASSWITFIFTIIAIASSLFVCKIAFNSEEKIVSKIYGFPIFRVGIFYALAQLIIGIVICVISAFVTVPYWIALLISVILLGAAAIGIIITDNTRDMVEELDENIKSDTQNITYFKIDISGIVDSCDSTDLKSELEKLNELIRFSDPVTGEATKDIEDSIKEMLADLKTSVIKDDANNIKLLIKKITNAVKDRNRICKANKV